MQLRIYNDCDNRVFPKHEEGKPLPWKRKDIEVVEIKVNQNCLTADLIWDSMDYVSLPDEVWDLFVNDSLFPAFALKPCVESARMFPYLKKVKELGITNGDALVLGKIIDGSEESIQKEFNVMTKHDEKLLDGVFRWEPEKVDRLISNIVEINEFQKSIDEMTDNMVKRTKVIRDKADRERYLDIFERVSVYRVVEATIESSRREFQREENYFWLYLISKVEKRCKDGLRDIRKELSSFTERDVKWFVDKGYLGKVKSVDQEHLGGEKTQGKEDVNLE